MAEREFQRSEALLANILPQSIASRLKQRTDAAIADRFEAASVLFADLEGYTALAGEVTPEELIAFLDRIFTEFDQLVERHGLEKIKTTGDSYMVVSGVPEARSDHAEALAHLSLDMLEASVRFQDPLGRVVPVRIGMACGPVIAGVVGKKKFFFDVWGDTVNIASRMETTGSAGQIQVSEAMYTQLKAKFILRYHGKTSVKGKGIMCTWELLSKRQIQMVG
jgi:adenylate cyclase